MSRVAYPLGKSPARWRHREEGSLVIGPLRADLRVVEQENNEACSTSLRVSTKPGQLQSSQTFLSS